MSNKKFVQRVSKILLWVLSLALVTTVLTMVVLAKENVEYVDAEGTTQYTSIGVTVEDVTDIDTDWTETWYIAGGNITIPNRVTVTGEVNLILANNADLTIEGGIGVMSGNSLTIWAQSHADDWETSTENVGKLTATAEMNAANAGIGGNNGQAAGTITINGGVITAKGSNNDTGNSAATTSPGGAGIGGGGAVGNTAGGAGGTIEINNGKVTATGGRIESDNDGGSDITLGGGGGAGIGGGAGSPAGGGGNITINDGHVTATGGIPRRQFSGSGAGIGGGGSGGIGGTGGTIEINGGTVIATGGAASLVGTSTGNWGGSGAGVGGGGGFNAVGGTGGTISINGGDVTATGGRFKVSGAPGNYTSNERSGMGAGIGGGGGGTSSAGGLSGVGINAGGASGTIVINEATVNATGGQAGSYGGGGSGIGGGGGAGSTNSNDGVAPPTGGGLGGVATDITITDSIITATGGVSGSFGSPGMDIGGGARASGSPTQENYASGGTLNITDSEVTLSTIGHNAATLNIENTTILGPSAAEGVYNSNGKHDVTITSFTAAPPTSGIVNNEVTLTATLHTTRTRGFADNLTASGEGVVFSVDGTDMTGTIYAEAVPAGTVNIDGTDFPVWKATLAWTPPDIGEYNLSVKFIGNGRFESATYTTTITDYEVTDPTKRENVPYVNAAGLAQTAVPVATAIYDNTGGDNNLPTAWSTGWYVAEGEVTIPSRVTVAGEVNLILANNADLTIEGGIQVQGTGNSLIIWAQSHASGGDWTDPDKYDEVGKLTATAADASSSAGIGGTSNGSTTVNNGGTVTINGGVITATGGSGNLTSGTGGGATGGGAGIGGGGTRHDTSTYVGGFGGDGGTININNGKIIATGGTDGPETTGTMPKGGTGAGIGGGGGTITGGMGGNITILGGHVTATGGADTVTSGAGPGGGAGIGGGGGGFNSTSSAGGGASGTIIIRDAVVIATSPVKSHRGAGGAGIGGGGSGRIASGGTLSPGGAATSITIERSTVTAQGSDGSGISATNDNGRYGADIGGGGSLNGTDTTAAGGNLSITGSTVTLMKFGTNSTVTVTGSTINGDGAGEREGVYNASGKHNVNITLSASPSDSIYINDGDVTFTAEIYTTRTSGFATPSPSSDAVTFSVGGTQIGSSVAFAPKLDSSSDPILTDAGFPVYVATANWTPSAIADYTITATFATDTRYAAGTGSLTYKVTPQPITAVAVTDVATPVKGGAMMTTATAGATSYTAGAGAVSWTPSETGTGSKFLGGKQYTATVTLTAATGYTFGEDGTYTGTASINGTTVTDLATNAVVSGGGTTLTLKREFDELDPKAITAITRLSGTVKEEYVHGETLDLTNLAFKIEYDDGTIDESVAYSDLSAKGVTLNYAHGTTLSHTDDDGENLTIEFTIALGVPRINDVLTLTVEKGSQAKPTEPTEVTASRTAESISLVADADYQYRRSTVPSGWEEWQNSAVFTGLTPDTTYNFQRRLIATANLNASPESDSLTIKTNQAAISGTVTITGGSNPPQFGETLTANTSLLISTPSVTLGELTYVWKRGATTIGDASGETYQLVQADIGQPISVTVSAANTTGSRDSSATANVVKATQTAPTYAPTEVEASRTSESITLAAVAGLQYRIGTAGTWEDSPVFTGLSPNQEYDFYVRYAVTDTHFASDASSSAKFKTEKGTLSGDVTAEISGTVALDGELTATLINEPSNAGTLSYQWRSNGEDIAGANSKTYTLVEADVGKTISVVITAEHYSNSVTSDETAAVARASQSAPAAPTVSGSPTATSITLNAISAPANDSEVQYRIAGTTPGAWQTSTTFDNLTPNTAYTFQAGFLNSTTHADAISVASSPISTVKAALGGSVSITGNAIYGETLTAVTTGLSTTPSGVDPGTLTYQWKSGGANTGTNSSSYQIVTADIGKSITVTVTAADCIGDVTSSPTDTVEKATPSVLTPPTAAGITYGAALSTSGFTGGSSGGTWNWTNGATIPTVTNSGYEVTFDPTDTDNYDWSKVTTTATIQITVSPRELTGISFTADNKEYDGNTTATVATVSTPTNIVGGDTVGVNITTAAFANANVDTGKTVSISAWSLTGTSANNYSLPATRPTATANITAAPLTITAGDISVSLYAPAPTSFTYTLSTLKGADTRDTIFTTPPTFSISPTFDSNTNGTFAIEPSGAVAPNYDITYQNGTLTVLECEHDDTTTETTTEPTCGSEGLSTTTCNICNETTGTSPIDRLQHIFTNYSGNTATCTAGGIETATCDRENCTQENTRPTSSLDHDFQDYESDDNATCTEHGTETGTCVRCDETNSIMEIDSMLPHTPKTTNCTECENCTTVLDRTCTAGNPCTFHTETPNSPSEPQPSPIPNTNRPARTPATPETTESSENETDTVAAEVQTDTDEIVIDVPKAVVEEIAASLPVAQIAATSAGTQVVTTTSSNAGQNAVLLVYNDETEEFEVVSASTVDEDGTATVNLPGAGDYIVVVAKTGDLTGTGNVTAADALLLLQALTGNAELNPLQKFLTSSRSDSQYTATDALNILKFVAGMIDEL